MTSISASGNVLSFSPKDPDSYYYEAFPCVKAKTENIGGIQFTITYPPGMSFTLELQSKANCEDPDYQSEWFEIAGLTGDAQVVTMDLGVYQAANLDAITGFVFATFTQTGNYTLSNFKFICGDLSARKLTFGTKPHNTAQSVPGLTDLEAPTIS